MKKGKRNSLIAGTVVIGVVAFLAYSIERSAQWTGTAYASIVVEVFDEEHFFDLSPDEYHSNTLCINTFG